MRRIFALLLTVLLLNALAAPACAVETTNLVLLLEDKDATVSGATFEIYRVGEKNTEGKLVLTGDFSDYPVEPNVDGEDSSAEASALYAFAKQDGLTPYAEVVTNSYGAATVIGLAPGLYLMAGQPHRQGDFLYHTEPQLILMPQKDPNTGEILKNPVRKVKFSREPYTEEPVSRKVLKIWNDYSGYNRPASVTVHLLENGSVHSTVTLNAQNQWRHVWEDLDAAVLWQITEDVPEGYTVTVEQEDTTFLLTNSAPEGTPPETTAPTETESSSAGGNIPQTGTLWWPVTVVAGLGILVFVAGGHFLKKKALKLLGILLLTAAMLMIANDVRKQSAAEETSLEVLSQLEVNCDTTVQIPEMTSQQLQIPDWQRNPHMEMPETVIDGTAYIGTLEIPVLKLELPVAGTTTGENLQKAPCRYSGSTYIDNLVLGAHNYDAHFGRLKQLSYGDIVRMTDLDGNVFSYQVADFEILQPEQLDDLLGGGWPLTLYTCTPGGQSRVIVRCEKLV